jgi:phage gpG-like protein
MRLQISKRDLLTPDLLARLARAKNPKPALQAMGLTVVSLAQRAFTSPSLRPQAWAPLKPATLKRKAAKGYGTKPLIAEGVLAQSPRIVTVTDRTVTVGSDRRVGSHSLAAIHQLGSTDGRIPARPFFPFDKNGRPTDRAKRNILAAARRALALERR